jgi:hypothetical protein
MIVTVTILYFIYYVYDITHFFPYWQIKNHQ